MPATRESYRALSGSQWLHDTIEQCHRLYGDGMKASYDAKKKSLPLVCFMATFVPTPRGGKEGGEQKCWRVQAGVRLNGLIMHDYDKLSKQGFTPQELFNDLPAHWFDDRQDPCAVLYAGDTPSADGLRLVMVANPDLNIEQNQEALLNRIRALCGGKYAALEKDGQCINADRGSFMVDDQSVFYMNDLIFDYDNEEYDRKWGNYYRKKAYQKACPSPPKGRDVEKVSADSSGDSAASSGNQTSLPSGKAAGRRPEVGNGLGWASYHGVPYTKILDTWFDQNGGVPEEGDRHKVMLLLVADIRYICNNNAEFTWHVVSQLDFVRRWLERASSSKEAKGEALQQPDGMIRNLPAKTSNAIFFRRLENAKETIEGDVMHLHLYMFDTELDSQTAAQKGGTWIGKHDLELKAFHNETSGVDYANGDSVNDTIPIYWNQCVTGTPISLAKKINMANVNDGLCSRICFCKIWPEKYKMLPRGSRSTNHEVDVRLKEWGYRFDTVKGELPVQRLVNHVYDLCAAYARQAEEAQDDVLDFLRKRAVFYAIWFTIPRILGRQWEQYRDTRQVEVNDEDLQFASIVYEAVIYWQDYYFGAMLQNSWQNAANEHVVRKAVQDRTAAEFRALPQVFTAADLDGSLTDAARKKRLQRWRAAGYIRPAGTTRPQRYEKMVSDIVL